MYPYKRYIFHEVASRLKEPRKFIQVVSGPRQTGKTTLARQIAESSTIPVHYASADDPTLRDRTWIEQQWELGRMQASKSVPEGSILILDEIQKVTQWSEVVKRLWDEDTASGLPLKVMLLGSSRLLMQRGLTESLAGRFEIIPVTHWSYAEMREAFGWTIDQYIYFGGYPGAVDLIGEEKRWASYISDSLIETTLSRDILLLTRIDKPALLRRLFLLGCDYSGQILSYQKMLGQLQDAGNTTTLAHYLELLSSAGILTGIQKYSGKKVRQRSSSPKLLVMNTALMTATSGFSFDDAREDREYWGRLVESAVGAHLLNRSAGKAIGIYYWRERGLEIDFVLRSGKVVVAIEVKSGRQKLSRSGMDAFSKSFQPKRKFVVGGDAMSLEEFLNCRIEELLNP